MLFRVVALLAVVVCVRGAPVGVSRQLKDETTFARVNTMNNVSAIDILKMTKNQLDDKYPGVFGAFNVNHQCAGLTSTVVGSNLACMVYAAWNYQPSLINTASTPGRATSYPRFEVHGVYKIIPVLFNTYLINADGVRSTLELGFARYVFKYTPGTANNWGLVWLQTYATTSSILRIDKHVLIDLPVRGSAILPLYDYADNNVVTDLVQPLGHTSYDFLLEPSVYDPTYTEDVCAQEQYIIGDPCYTKIGEYTNLLYTEPTNLVLNPIHGTDAYLNSINCKPTFGLSQNCADVSYATSAADGNADVNIANVVNISFIIGVSTDAQSLSIGLPNSRCAGVADAYTCWPTVWWNWQPFTVTMNGCTSACTKKFKANTIYKIYPMLLYVVVRRTSGNVQGFDAQQMWVQYVYEYQSANPNIHKWAFAWVDVGTDSKPLPFQLAIGTNAFDTGNLPLVDFTVSALNSTALQDQSSGFNREITSPLTVSGITAPADSNTCGTGKTAISGLVLNRTCYGCYADNTVGYKMVGATSFSNYINPDTRHMGNYTFYHGLCVPEIITSTCIIVPSCLLDAKQLKIRHRVDPLTPAPRNFNINGDVQRYDDMNGLNPNDILNANFSGYTTRSAVRSLHNTYDNPHGVVTDSWVVAWWDFEPFYLDNDDIDTGACETDVHATPFAYPCEGKYSGLDTYLYKSIPMITQAYTTSYTGQIITTIDTFEFIFVYHLGNGVFTDWQFVSVTRNAWNGNSFLGHYTLGAGLLPLLQVSDTSRQNLNTGYCTSVQCGYDVITQTDITTTPTGTTEIVSQVNPLSATSLTCGVYTYNYNNTYCTLDAANYFKPHIPDRSAFTPLINYNVVDLNYDFLLAQCAAIYTQSLPCLHLYDAVTTTPLNTVYVRTLIADFITAQLSRSYPATPIRVEIVRFTKNKITSTGVQESAISVEYVVVTNKNDNNDYPLSVVQFTSVSLFMVDSVYYSSFTAQPTVAKYVYTVAASALPYSLDYMQNADDLKQACVMAYVQTTCTPPACGGTCTNYSYWHIVAPGINTDAPCRNSMLGTYQSTVLQTLPCVSTSLAATSLDTVSVFQTYRAAKVVGYCVLVLFVAVSYGLIISIQHNTN